MCGRFILTLEAAPLEQEFGITGLPEDWQPRFNIAPTQQIPVVTDSENKRVEFFRWGLIPSWAKDPSIGNKLINARAETLAEKPSFRKAFQQRRCIILADGFYEWQRQPGKKGPAVPYVFRRKENKPFAFAGLWEVWRPSEQEDWIKTCTIITCGANELVSQIHNRMPVMLDGSTAWKWLEGQSRTELEALLAPYPSEDMVTYQVSTRVNTPDYDSRELVQPVQ